MLPKNLEMEIAIPSLIYGIRTVGTDMAVIKPLPRTEGIRISEFELTLQ